MASRHREGCRTRAGYTIAEALVAFVLLGIGLTGICPLVVMQLRMSSKIGKGLDPASASFGAGQTWLIVPASDPWVRKLGVAASIQAQTDTLPSTGNAIPTTVANVVSITAPIETSADGLSVTIQVSVTAATP